MKKIAFLAAAVLLCASCFHVNKNYTGGKSVVKGEGPVISRDLDLVGFDTIVINGQADVVFAQSETFQVSVRTQENIFDVIDFHVDGTTLILETRDKKEVRADTYEVTVQAPLLRKLEVNGAADVEIPGGLRQRGQDFNCEVNGAGDFDFSGLSCENCVLEVNGAADILVSGLDAVRLKGVINGAGDMKLSGKVGDIDLEVNGAGDIDARNLSVSGEKTVHKSGLASIKF